MQQNDNALSLAAHEKLLDIQEEHENHTHLACRSNHFLSTYRFLLARGTKLGEKRKYTPKIGDHRFYT
jgi:hypothetical protein